MGSVEGVEEGVVPAAVGSEYVVAGLGGGLAWAQTAPELLASRAGQAEQRADAAAGREAEPGRGPETEVSPCEAWGGCLLGEAGRETCELCVEGGRRLWGCGQCGGAACGRCHLRVVLAAQTGPERREPACAFCREPYSDRRLGQLMMESHVHRDELPAALHLFPALLRQRSLGGLFPASSAGRGMARAFLRRDYAQEELDELSGLTSASSDAEPDVSTPSTALAPGPSSATAASSSEPRYANFPLHRRPQPQADAEQTDALRGQTLALTSLANDIRHLTTALASLRLHPHTAH